MLRQYRRIAPFILLGVLVLNLIVAVTNNTRGSWVSVPIIALLLAITLRRRTRP